MYARRATVTEDLAILIFATHKYTDFQRVHAVKIAIWKLSEIVTFIRQFPNKIKNTPNKPSAGLKAFGCIVSILVANPDWLQVKNILSQNRL